MVTVYVVDIHQMYNYYFCMEKYDYEDVNQRLQDGKTLTSQFRNEVWIANQGLIFDVIAKELKKYKPKFLSDEQRDDLTQYIEEKFFDLIEKYDPTKGVPPNAFFREFLGYEIRNEIKKIAVENYSENVAFEDWNGSYEEDSSQKINYEEEKRLRDELGNEIERKIRTAKKTTIKEKLDLQILVYMEFLGAYGDGAKSFDQIKGIVEKKFPGQKIKTSEINKIISNFTSILYKDSKYRAIESSFMPERKIQSRDLALMNYIAEQNKKIGNLKQYPTRDDILHDDKMQQMFGCVDTINKSIKRLREIKHCQIEIKQQRKSGSHGGGGYWLRNPEETLSLSNQDLFTIGLLEHLIKLNGNTPLAKKFDSIKEKILEEAGAVSFEKTKDEPVSFMLTQKQIANLINPLSEEIFEGIFTATRNHLFLNFSYTGKEKKIDVHLKPYHLIFYDDEWFILGAEEDEFGNEKYSWFASKKIDCIYGRRDEKFIPNQDYNIDDFMPFSTNEVR